MGEQNDLYADLNLAFDDQAPQHQVLEIIKRPLNEIAMTGPDGLGGIWPVSRHPLGFYTLTLADGVCMHLWPVRYPPDEEFPDNTVLDVHQHSWDLKSWILDGRLGNQEAVVEMETSPHALDGLSRRPEWMRNGDYYRLFDAQSGHDGWDYMANINIAARLVSLTEPRFYEPGETYSLPVGNFHSSDWEVDTVTLMIAENYPGHRNLTLGPLIAEFNGDCVDSHFVERLRYSPERTVEIARELATRLAIDG